jgi:hypothetical protein
MILNQVKRASHFFKIIVACCHRLPKLPESIKLKQAIPNKGSLFHSHCAFAPSSGQNLMFTLFLCNTFFKRNFLLLSRRRVLRLPSCAYTQFAVIYTSFAVMGYKALHGVTWRYIFV